MSRAEYIRIHSNYFPPYIITLYQIDAIIAEDGYFYINTTKGIYGLKQADMIAYNQLISHMDPHIYYPLYFINGL